MTAQEIKFGDVAIDKKEFYSPKHTLSLKDVQLDKIVTSNKWKINETTCKYFVGYCKDDLIRPLCVIMPQMNGYIKYLVMEAKICHLLAMIEMCMTSMGLFGIRLENY